MKSFLYLTLAIGVLAAACESAATEQKVTPATTVTATSTEAAAPADVTTLQWIDSVKDVGTITEGQVVDISYRFKNTGTKPLVIKNVNVSCGCTVAEKPEQPVAPGAEGIIKASFNSAGKPGPNSKSIFVIANTEGSGEHKLQFTVEVKAKKAE
ncbi:DUF1573 domain-containing protein [Paraflavitalea sp. CAU 1676]|uniref:DUF1573 domain-containing protein n=1 Tax=Paraflavitalea sp. CAU 1676 TaxID=3032598 RepID=UPI0023DC9E09|nr:DUF1573 domain-containing protein [Paraflavitalea sp. CAU 1676]MDF2187748.1 DUF1573 domain-containing protein [Paraflavitalea sp. CAU 1676]